MHVYLIKPSQKMEYSNVIRYVSVLYSRGDASASFTATLCWAIVFLSKPINIAGKEWPFSKNFQLLKIY